MKNEKKRMRYCWIILVKGFCPLKIQIIQFPDGFHLNIIKQVFLLLRQTELKHKLKDVHGSYVQRRKLNANTVFPYYGKHKTSTSPENKGVVSNENQRRHKTAFSHWDKKVKQAQFQTQESCAK